MQLFPTKRFNYSMKHLHVMAIIDVCASLAEPPKVIITSYEVQPHVVELTRLESPSNRRSVKVNEVISFTVITA